MKLVGLQYNPGKTVHTHRLDWPYTSGNLQRHTTFGSNGIRVKENRQIMTIATTCIDMHSTPMISSWLYTSSTIKNKLLQTHAI